MKVALDATPLALENGGLRRYTEELGAALRAEFSDDEFILVPSRSTGKWWSCVLPYDLVRRRFALFHGTNFEVPYVPVCPSVMTLHDLSPWLEPAWHVNAGRVRRRTPILMRLGLTRKIITPTEAIRREAIGHFRLHPDHVVAVHEAASSHFRPCPRQDRRRYFLFTGTLEPRKNLETIIEAWRHLRPLEIDLVLVGRRREDCPRIEPQPGLRLLGSVPDADLPLLYSSAVATLYPSLYEGFGLPVLEAMQCGSPVIASRDPAISEVSGGAAVHVHALDVAGWIEAMRAMAVHTEHRAERVAAGLRRAAEFSWAKTARLTREVYIEALRG